MDGLTPYAHRVHTQTDNDHRVCVGGGALRTTRTGE